MPLQLRGGPLVTVEAALGYDPLDPSPSWTDVTEGLRSGRIHRGKSHELDRQQAGTFVFTWRNRDDRWNKWNTSSPYYPNLKPMLRMRCKAQWNLLTAIQSSHETNVLTGHAASANCTLTPSNAPSVAPVHGSYVLLMQSLAAGSMFGLIDSPRCTVAPNTTYTAVVSFANNGTARNCRVYIRFYDAGGILQAGYTGNPVSDSGGAFVQASVTATAPSNAASADVLYEVIGTGGAGEVHEVDAWGVFPGVNTTWSLGGEHYQATGYVESVDHDWPNPHYAETTVTFVDGFKVLSLAKAAKTTHHDLVMANTPSGYYRLNEKGEASAVNGVITAVDDSGNGYDGTIGGSPAGYQQMGALAAEIGGAIDLGTARTATGAGWIELPSAIMGGGGTGDFTIAMWVKPRSVNQGTPKDRLWMAFGVGTQSFYLVLLSDGTLNFVCLTAVPDKGGILDSGTNPLTLGYQNHVAVVKAGTTGPANWAIYINGVDVSNHAGETTNGDGNVSVTAAASLIGAYESGGVVQNALDGVVDEFQWYTSALSSGDVAALFAAGHGLGTTALTGDRFAALLDIAGIPAADRQLDAGQFLMQPVKQPLYNNSPLPLTLDYIDSEGYPADFFFAADGDAIFHDRSHSTPAVAATFGDGPGELQALPSPPRDDDLDLWPTVVCQADDGAAQMVTDSAAADEFVDRTLSRTNLKNADDADVATLAAAYHARYSAPASRVRALTVLPRRHPGTLWPVALALDLGDRIEYNRADLPGGGDPLALDLRIEGLDVEFNRAMWRTTWMTVPT